MDWLKKKYNRWLLNWLIRYTGIRLEPEPGIWGLLTAKEEDDVLAGIYGNDAFIALLKKYAETRVKTILSTARLDADYWKNLGEFLAFNGIIMKSKRAFKNKNERTNKSDRN